MAQNTKYTAFKGFSLIELMVVIAIVCILAAVAVPSYQQYTIRAKIIDSIVVMKAVSDQVFVSYEGSGSYPDSIVINGYTVSGFPGWAYVNFGNIYDFLYSVPSPDNAAILFAVDFTGLEGIPGYVAPTGEQAIPQSNGYNTVYFAVRDFGGVIRGVCGQYNSASSAQAVPFSYLPSSCQCTDTYSFWLNGSGGC